MNITNVKIRRYFKDNPDMKACVSIVIDDSIAIHDIKVIQGPQRLFMAMPSYKGNGGVYHDIAHPITQQARDALESVVLKAYEDFKSALKED